MTRYGVGQVTVDRAGPTTWVVAVKGEHDLSTVGGLRGELDAIFAQGTNVIVDLSEATFIESAVLRELILAQHRVDADDGEQLVIVAPRDGFAARLLTMASVDHMFSITQTRADALDALAR